jgi:hypothetical protein
MNNIGLGLLLLISAASIGACSDSAARLSPTSPTSASVSSALGSDSAGDPQWTTTSGTAAGANGTAAGANGSTAGAGGAAGADGSAAGAGGAAGANGSTSTVGAGGAAGADGNAAGAGGAAGADGSAAGAGGASGSDGASAMSGRVATVSGTCPALAMTLQGSNGTIVTNGATAFTPAESCAQIEPGSAIAATGAANASGARMTAKTVKVSGAKR